MNEPNPQFDFYEKVLARPLDKTKNTINGELGTVLGRILTEDRVWYYSVHFEATDCCWCLFENELVATGEFASKEDFFDGSSLRVLVDKDGRGRLSDQNDLNEDSD